MSENKTREGDENVREFLNGVEDEQKRIDSFVLLELMKEVTGEKPRIWGGNIVGFGRYHYQYESGREGDWFLTGFAPRKKSLSIYIMPGFDHYHNLLEKLGSPKTGRSCLYLNSLEDVDMKALRDLVRRSVADMREKYG